MKNEIGVMTEYLTKFAKYEILKPEKWVGGDSDGESCSWSELAKLMLDVLCIESRMANLILSESQDGLVLDAFWVRRS